MLVNAAEVDALESDKEDGGGGELKCEAEADRAVRLLRLEDMEVAGGIPRR